MQWKAARVIFSIRKDCCVNGNRTGVILPEVDKEAARALQAVETTWIHEHLTVYGLWCPEFRSRDVGRRQCSSLNLGLCISLHFCVGSILNQAAPSQGQAIAISHVVLATFQEDSQSWGNQPLVSGWAVFCLATSNYKVDFKSQTYIQNPS